MKYFPALTCFLAVTLGVLGWASPAFADEEFPYELDEGTEAAVLGSAALLFGLGIWAHQGLEPLTPEEIASLDPDSINSFDRSATRRWSPGAARASNIMLYTTAVAPLSLLATDDGSRQPWTLTTMYLETMALQGGLTYLVKNLFTRTRPYVYNDDPAVPLAAKMETDARLSFYSGHTSSAFASMVFLAGVFGKLYPDSDARGWVWGGCLAAAATTGYLRYAAGKHYPTDILAGAVMGAFVGYLVPAIHELETPGAEPGKSRQTVTLGFSLGF